MKVIVAGGRNFDDYRFVEQHLNDILRDRILNKEEIEIVSGRCDTGKHTFIAEDGMKVCGVDGLGERYAEENGFELTTFPAEWNRYGKFAGPRRNAQMAVYSDILIAFWDGKSKGTKNMIDNAKNDGLKVYVVNY